MEEKNMIKDTQRDYLHLSS